MTRLARFGQLPDPSTQRAGEMAPIAPQSADIKFYADSNGVRITGPNSTVVVLPFDVPIAPSGFEYRVFSFATWTVHVTFPPPESSLLGFEDAYLAPRLEFKLQDGANVNFNELDYSPVGPSDTISSKFTPISPGPNVAVLTARVLQLDPRSTVTVDGSILVTLRLVKILPVVEFSQPLNGLSQTNVPLDQARPVPVLLAAPSPLGPLSQARPEIAAPVTPGRDIGDPIRPAPIVFSPIPQNGVPMSRLARFGSAFGGVSYGSSVNRRYAPTIGQESTGTIVGPPLTYEPRNARFSPLSRVDTARLPPAAPVIQNVSPFLAPLPVSALMIPGDYYSVPGPKATAFGPGYTGPGSYVITDASSTSGAVVFDRDGRMIGKLPIGTIVRAEEEGFYSDEGRGGVSARISRPINGNLEKVATSYLKPVPQINPSRPVRPRNIRSPQFGQLGRFNALSVNPLYVTQAAAEAAISRVATPAVPVQTPAPLSVAGLYRITIPNGLRAAVRTGAGGSRPVANLPYGSIVRIISNNIGGGWYQISYPFVGYVQAGDGTGLTPTQIQPGSVNQRRMYANRIIPPVGPSIRGYGNPIG